MAHVTDFIGNGRLRCGEALTADRSEPHGAVE